MAVGGGISSAASAYVRPRKRIPTWAIKPLRRIRTRLRIKLLHCFCADWVNPAFATSPPKYTAQFLSPAVIRNFAKDPNCDMTEDFLVEALSKGDECFGILDGRTLAAYSWYASQPTRIRPRDLMMQIDGRYVYMYKGFTSDAYRGQRLHAIGKTLALQTYMSRGFRGIISYVEFETSSRSSRRGGWGRGFSVQSSSWASSDIISCIGPADAGNSESASRGHAPAPTLRRRTRPRP